MGTEEKTSELEQPERLREIKRQRKKKNHSVVLPAVSILLFVILITASVILYVWLDKGLQDEVQEAAVNSDEVEMVQSSNDQPDMLTREEAEKLIAEARKEGAEEVLGQLADSINNNSSITSILRPLYKDCLVIASEGDYHFVPIDHTLKMNDYKEENLLVLNNGLVEYAEDGVLISHKGIDVSKHQGDIDWAKVAADGVEFAFIRVGNRGYGSGAIVEDPKFEENVVGAITNGVKVGVYFFSQAVTVEEAKQEARFVLEKVAPYKITCPIVLDVEKVEDNEARMNKISKEQRTENTLAFLQEIEAAGYKTMLYHNMEMAVLKLDMSKLEKYEKWFAYYNKEMYYPYAYSVWQYSDKGKVDGIQGNVDMNISFHLWEE